MNRAQRHHDSILEVSGHRYNLADELLEQTQDRREIRNQLLHTFITADDTTSAIMSNVFFNLARNPEVYRELRAEITRTDIDLESADRLVKLGTLRNVINGRLRFTPFVGQRARVALQDTSLPREGGHSQNSPIHIRRGTSVQINYYALHQRIEIFGEDVEVFRPSRWNELELSTWDFLPFSGGPRVCPAQQMALVLVCYTIAKLVQRFPNENRDPALEYVERYRMTSESWNGCKVALLDA